MSNQSKILDAQVNPAAVRSASVNPLLHGPVLPALIGLALPTTAVLFMTTILSIAETYFVSSLGLHAIAAASLVVPVNMLMVMISNGGIGGGVSSSIARARGANLLEKAESLAWHALIIAVIAGLIFTLAAIGLGTFIYSALGGTGETLHLALIYSNILFAGAISFWTVVLMQSALRGAGNVKIPAIIMLSSTVAGLILSPVLILGWFGIPSIGIAGAGVAQVLCSLGSLVAIILYMRKSDSTLRLRRYPLRRDHFKEILGIGLLSSLSALMSNFSMTALTAAAGVYGVASIAGYGIASRLELLLVPVMFGFGTAIITMVGTNLGAGNVARARQAAMINALFVAALVEMVGLAAALIPQGWVEIFSYDAGVIKTASQYLLVVGPLYAFIAITTELYFAGQGAGKIGWPLTATATRLLFNGIAAYWVIAWHASLEAAFVVVALGIVASGLISLIGFKLVKWRI